MGLSINQVEQFKKSVCAKLSSIIDEGIILLQQLKKLLFTPINKLKALLRTFHASALEKLNELRLNVNSNMDKFDVPFDDVSIMTEIQNIINSCSLLKVDFPNPVAFFRGIKGGIKDAANELFDSLSSDLSLLEMPIVKLIDHILESIKGFDLSKILSKIYQAANCVDAICGSSSILYEKLQQITDLLDQCYITAAGNFDQSKIFSDLGLSLDNIKSIETVQKIYNNTKSSVNNSIDKGVSFAKQFL